MRISERNNFLEYIENELEIFGKVEYDEKGSILYTQDEAMLKTEELLETWIEDGMIGKEKPRMIRTDLSLNHFWLVPIKGVIRGYDSLEDVVNRHGTP